MTGHLVLQTTRRCKVGLGEEAIFQDTGSSKDPGLAGSSCWQFLALNSGFASVHYKTLLYIVLAAVEHQHVAAVLAVLIMSG